MKDRKLFLVIVVLFLGFISTLFFLERAHERYISLKLIQIEAEVNYGK